MKITICSLYGDLLADETSQPDCDCGRFRVPHAGIKREVARSSDAMALRKGLSDSEPASSSPSRRIVIFSGSLPSTFIKARQASMKVINCPLSSAATRPVMILRPLVVSVIFGNGLLSQRFSGSTDLHVIVAVEEDAWG